MSNIKARAENMLFNGETTYKTDFSGFKIQPLVETRYKEKRSSCLMARMPPLKNIQTLHHWKHPIRFDLMVKKRLVDMDPRDKQKPYSPPPRTELEQVRKTRPRVYMTPAIAIDDIDDEETRRILIEDMYMSDMVRANKEVRKSYLSVRAPVPDMPAPSNPLALPKLKPPYVSPEWRMETVKWDKKQLRAYCDPNKEFWTRRPIPPCKACEETATVQEHRKLTHQKAQK